MIMIINQIYNNFLNISKQMKNKYIQKQFNKKIVNKITLIFNNNKIMIKKIKINNKVKEEGKYKDNIKNNTKNNTKN